VYPRDKRYKKLIGRTAILPVLGRKIPIIADNAVDPKFGTGAVKVTPAHDPTDFEIGARHKLPQINVMNSNATINANGGAYNGMDRYAAREKIVEQLTREGLLDHIQEHTISLGRCQRCETVVEPLISTQWFVKIKPLARPAIRAVKTGQTKIIPARFNKIYYQWMDAARIRDWCISRQLWWGHRIPVWYCENGHETCARTDPTECATCDSTNIRQDEDVLDTWFSSGLWPFSTLGWPQATRDLKTFYPTTVLETGYDIIFFWVAHMMMLGIEFTGKPPFEFVYLHGMMRHLDGSKISKSNPQDGDNPLDVIAAYSADALRYTIVTSSTPGNDTKLDLQKVEGARNFANKIWNMGRFIISNLQTANLKADNLNLEKLRRATLSLPDRWVLSRLHRAIATVNQSFTGWQFGEGTRAVYEFLWDEFADWYIEAAKIALNGDDARAKERTLSVLVYAFDQALRLLHPVMPFVTEEVWQHLKRALENDFTGDFAGPAPTRGAWPEALIVAPFPKANPKWNDARAEKEFDALRDAIRAIRNARTEFKVEAGLRIPAIFSAGSARQLFASHRDVIAMLAHLDTHALTIEKTAAKPTRALALVAGGAEIFLPFAGMLDVEKEQARLNREMEKTRADVARQETLLASEFSKRAPKEVVEKTKEQLAANTDRLGKLDALLASLEGRAPKKKSSVKNAKKKTKRK
ncbi:MAG: valine--tRNA ligase, partial [Chloroflexi bacterium]|nr:valine--tRNA ligase [Chloroflexota bacterium]